MMGSQTFFLYFQKKTCKILVSFRNFIYPLIPQHYSLTLFISA